MNDNTFEDNTEPRVSDILKRVSFQHKCKLFATSGLVIVENLLEVFYPLASGIALDAVIRGDTPTALATVIVIFMFWVVGAIRRAADTRVYSAIYSDLVQNIIKGESQQSIDKKVTIAHANLAIQFVDFFEDQIPAIFTALLSVFGSVIMLIILEPVVGWVAFVLSALFLLLAVYFTKFSKYLATCLHHRLEEQPRVIVQGRMSSIKRHFRILSGRKIALSDLEAKANIVVGLMIAILFSTLFIHLSDQTGVSPGHIYTLMNYIWSFALGVDEMPFQLQELGKVLELRNRIRINIR
ncbi:MAG: ABC transporter six-transmembrane domain-containing protein [Pseudomonadota bacterium]